MNKYKQATKLKLRFETSKGHLSMESLWELSMEDLNRLAVNTHNTMQKSAVSFIEETSKMDAVLELKLEILKDVIADKKAIKEERAQAQAKEEHRSKIQAVITQKEDKALGKKSIQELKQMID